MYNPKVSIVIPAYNIEKYIIKCINSLINQSYRNLEIIVVDDGSLDNTWSVISDIASTDERIIPIQQNNGRTAKARNNGLSRVSGEYIMFVDGDDYLSPNAIKDNILYFNEDENLDWVSFSVIRVNEKGQQIKQSKTFNSYIVNKDLVIENKDMLSAYLSHKLSGLCCGTIYKWDTVNDMRFPVGEHYEDNFYFLEMLWKTRKGMLSTKGQYYYLERNGSSQFAKITRAHLISCLHNEQRALMNFRKHFTGQSDIIDKLEDSNYYYLKSMYSKGIDGGEEVFDAFKQSFTVPHHKNYRYEIICMMHILRRKLLNLIQCKS